MATKDYSKGYRAGLKRKYREETEKAKAEAEAEAEEIRIEQYRVQIYCAALNGILSTDRNWSVGDKRVSSTEQYASLAETVTRHAMEEKPWKS